MIQIQNLKIQAGEKEILKGITLDFQLGKNYLLLGKNGSGKSSLSHFLMGNPLYEHISGSIEIDGEDLLALSPDERAKKGIFLSFQNIPEIPGVNLGEFLRTIYNTHIIHTTDSKGVSPFLFKRIIKKHIDELEIPEEFLSRDLNVGFSGGEKRKLELLQIKLLSPKYIILDEIDSGLDVNAFRTVAQDLQTLDSKDITFIVITHHFKIMDFIHFDHVYMLEGGILKYSGDSSIVDTIIDSGF